MIVRRTIPARAGRRRPAAALGLAAVAVLGGCSSAEDPGSPRPTTDGTRRPGHAATMPPQSIPPGVGAVVSLTVTPPASCRAGEPAPATATYETRDAARVAFLVDQQPVPGDPPVTGTFTIPLPCDGAVHTVQLTAAAADGRSTMQSRAVAGPDPT